MLKVRCFNAAKAFARDLRRVLVVATFARALLARRRVKAIRKRFKNRPPRTFALTIQRRFRGNRSRAALEPSVRERCLKCGLKV